MHNSQLRLIEDAVSGIFVCPPHLWKEIRNRNVAQRNAMSRAVTTVLGDG